VWGLKLINKITVKSEKLNVEDHKVLKILRLNLNLNVRVIDKLVIQAKNKVLN